MSMQTTSDNSKGEPMLDINVTPLIDVMLVLLIMLIITIPPQTHAVKLVCRSITIRRRRQLSRSRIQLE